jgi:flavin reductase (DIM6/NTAB) family NADH-FMN oxidoreductase RutF
MQHVDYLTVAEESLKQIKKGAFLTVQSNDTVNSMTIGWASIGFLWGRPVITVMVRKSRYTYELIEQSDEFTVSVPKTDMAEALKICGTKSGRDTDKLKACALELFPGEKVKTPILKIPGIHFECGIVFKSPTDPQQLVDSYKHLYPDKDYHTFYFGEIRYCYSTTDEK